MNNEIYNDATEQSSENENQLRKGKLMLALRLKYLDTSPTNRHIFLEQYSLGKYTTDVN